MDGPLLLKIFIPHLSLCQSESRGHVRVRGRFNNMLMLSRQFAQSQEILALWLYLLLFLVLYLQLYTLYDLFINRSNGLG